MKNLVYLLVVVSLVSFSYGVKNNEIDGFWVGAYGAGIQMETIVVKFNMENQIEWYKGEVNEKNRILGYYQLSGDSVLLTYETVEGRQFTLHGYVNRRKNYLDGNWETNDKGKGSFYLKKQKITEFFAQP